MDTTHLFTKHRRAAEFVLTQKTLRLGGMARGFQKIALPDVRRWVAVGAYASPYWNRVRHGEHCADIPAKTHFLLWEKHDGACGVLLPLLAGDCIITVSGGDDGVLLHADGGRAKPLPAGAAVACAATGSDVYRIVSDAMRAARRRLKSFQLREEKETPAFVDLLGWCTWNAFYHDVTADKVLAGFQSFRDGGVTPGYVLLDDGWQDVRDLRLSSFGINGERFPGGLRPLAAALKRGGARHFGVWHALHGYWLGLDPRGPLARQFATHAEHGVIRPWDGDGKARETVHLVRPELAARFLNQCHRLLRDEGVTLLKVDVQSVLGQLTDPHYGRVPAMRHYQRALQNSAVKNFNGNLIHCMSNTLDVAYHLRGTTVWRNSDDFIPGLPAEGQQEHIHANAISALFTSEFSLPDWDMFQTHHEHAEYHAAARALSGGPVYVSDVPGKEDFSIIRRVAADDGRVFRCDRPALPCRDSIFTDCRRDGSLLKLHNRSGAAALLGFFHCSAKEEPLSVRFTVSDVPDLRGEDFIARRHSTGAFARCGRADIGEIILPRMGWEILTLAPVQAAWFAALGRAGRYVGVTSLGKQTVSAKTAAVSVKESGEYLFWSATRPAAVLFNNKRLPVNYNRHLLTVSVPRAGKIEVTAKKTSCLRAFV